VAAWRKSGKTSEAFSQGQEFTAGGLRHWAHRLNKKPAAQRPVTQAKVTAPAGPAPVRLARVVRQPDNREGARQRPTSSQARPITPAPSPERPALTLREPRALTLEVGTVRIAVARHFDRETLAAVLAVLEQGGAR
jgi:hypothetical protein